MVWLPEGAGCSVGAPGDPHNSYSRTRWQRCDTGPGIEQCPAFILWSLLTLWLCVSCRRPSSLIWPLPSTRGPRSRTGFLMTAERSFSRSTPCTVLCPRSSATTALTAPPFSWNPSRTKKIESGNTGGHLRPVAKASDWLLNQVLPSTPVNIPVHLKAACCLSLCFFVNAFLYFIFWLYADVWLEFKWLILLKMFVLVWNLYIQMIQIFKEEYVPQSTLIMMLLKWYQNSK